MLKPLLLLALFALTACSPTDLLTAGISSDHYRKISSVAYQPGDSHSLDIYQPTEQATGKPVVVFFYGGAWRHGRKEDVAFVAQSLAAAGIMTVVPDYRLAPAVTYPAFIDDGAAAVAWTRQHIGEYGGDPRNMFVMGHSAGAYIAIMLATDPEYLARDGMKPGDLAGAIGLAGPYNFLPLTWPELKPIFEVVPDLKTTQPITYVDGHNPPMLLIAGAGDDTVNPGDNTIAMADKIGKDHGDVKKIIYPDVGHIGLILAFSPLFRDNVPVYEDTIGFISARTRQ